MRLPENWRPSQIFSRVYKQRRHAGRLYIVISNEERNLLTLETLSLPFNYFSKQGVVGAQISRSASFACLPHLISDL